ncbi:signal peptide peptidase SppA [Pseudoblastomonas halimionae]|uniref:Signal peptide peptidase SppA n=1 Tax=Alteriqipengyuania halimionae TaxID=1926630 RepID=A0A6I4U2N7_9SPHN|nr:signal peptide peptidase SppA [Alteriqipengyuania halimionae]MXP08742.1 signal peptide peptidase SppA [Alteriqipengyuania halimionae]
MVFARKVWKLLVGIKDGLVLIFMLLFFAALYALLTMRPSADAVRDGALFLQLDGVVVEEPAEVDPFDALLSPTPQINEYRARDLVASIEAAAEDDRIKAVVLDLSRFLGGGFIHMQDIGEALDIARDAGKPVYVHSLFYTDDAMLLAAHADEVWLDPLGAAMIAGPGGEQLYFGALLDRLKINARVYKVGTFKDAVEPYTSSKASAPSLAAREALYGDVWELYRQDVVSARPKIQLERITSAPAEWIEASGGDTAKAALDAGLVDKLGSWEEFGDYVASKVGKDPADDSAGHFANTGFDTYDANLEIDDAGRPIAVVTIAGEIVDGEAGPGTAGGDRIAELIDQASADDDLAALVVRVDSPGGSVTASEAIRRAITRVKAKDVPIVVSMGNVAASGGYWVSTPADRIFAEPGTITGSIGIFGLIPTFEDFLADWDVYSDGVRTTPLSGQPDPIAGFTPEVDRIIQSNIEAGYSRFIGLVAKNRGWKPEQVDMVGQGRVWSGVAARQNGLFDAMGGLDEALAYAAKQAELDAGEWHPRYLGNKREPFLSLIEQLTQSERGVDEAIARDLISYAAQRRRLALGTASVRLERLMTGGAGMQALCLDCDSGMAARPIADERGFWAKLAGMLK